MLAWRVDVNGVLPLWTFGKITNLWDAAEANVDVTQAELDVTRDGIRFDVRRAYFGLSSYDIPYWKWQRGVNKNYRFKLIRLFQPRKLEICVF